MITQTQQTASTMELEPVPYRRIGYYAEHRKEQVIWDFEDWEYPPAYCRNDLVDMPDVGIGRVTSVYNGVEIEVVKRMMV